MSQQTDHSSETPRLFADFLDPVDMIGCFHANQSLASINEVASVYSLFYPLSCDPAKTLGEHLRVMDHAPMSARYGCFADNVPGMNWRLPCGRMARVGERVVKSSTGYDLSRFLLHADSAWGSATHYVLRLRPMGEEEYHVTYNGAAEVMERIVVELVCGHWAHWLDYVVIDVSSAGDCVLDVGGNCLRGERDIFLGKLVNCGKELGADCEIKSSASSRELPLFSIKTTFSEGLGLAKECCRSLGGRAAFLCANSSVLIYADEVTDWDFVESIKDRVEAYGGHLMGLDSRWNQSVGREAAWSTTILGEWEKL